MNDRKELAQTSISFLLLRIGRKRCLLAGSAVKQLMAASRVHSSANSPQGLSGSASADSGAVRVVDLRRFDAPPTVHTDDEVVILVRSGNQLLGVLVHEVERVLSFSLDAIAEPPAVDDCWSDLIVGSVRHQEQTLLVIDHDRLVDLDDHVSASVGVRNPSPPAVAPE